MGGTKSFRRGHKIFHGAQNIRCAHRQTPGGRLHVGRDGHWYRNRTSGLRDPLGKLIKADAILTTLLSLKPLPEMWPTNALLMPFKFSVVMDSTATTPSRN